MNPDKDLSMPQNICGSDVLVWGPATAGERTSRGRVLPAGWVWTCGCGAYGAGYASETEADIAADSHPTADRLWKELGT